MEEAGLIGKFSIPEKTLERLLQYLRLLKRYQYLEQAHIFSHDLARVLRITPVLVRRDLMLIGIQGNNRRGYDVKNLLEQLEHRLNQDKVKNAILVGIENLGTASTDYFLSGDSQIKILANFDYFPEKINSGFPEIPCLGIHGLPDFITKNNVEIAVVAVTLDDIESIVKVLIDSGIRAIINLSPAKLEVPDNIYLQEFDLITGLEKSAFHVILNRS